MVPYKCEYVMGSQGQLKAFSYVLNVDFYLDGTEENKYVLLQKLSDTP